MASGIAGLADIVRELAGRATRALTAEDLLRRRTPIMLTDPPTDGVIRMLNEELAEVRAEPG